MHDALAIVLVCAGGALVGSIPFGLLLTRAAGLGDIRAVGSGNIGATNVLRTGRRDIAALTLLLDAAKGTAAVLVAERLAGLGGLAGLAAVAGHCWSVWLAGRGGKGGATCLGALLGMAWPIGVIACGLWLMAAGITRRSSVGTLTATGAPPVLLLFSGDPLLAILALLMAAVVFWRHKDNIARLLDGTEPRIGSAR